MAVLVHKTCCVCGLDVSRLRRTKDPRGNYYCRPCYTTLWELHRQRVLRKAQDVETAGVEPKVEPKSASHVGKVLSRAANALAVLRASSLDYHAASVVPVRARRVKRRIRGKMLRLSDLIGDEAWAEVEAARLKPSPEPEIPVSPITNPPVSALLDEYGAPPEYDRLLASSADDDDSGSFEPSSFSDMAIRPAAAL